MELGLGLDELQEMTLVREIKVFGVKRELSFFFSSQHARAQ